MYAKLKSIVAAEWPLILAVIRQVAWPAVLAAGYGVYDWYSSRGTFSLSSYVKVTLPALFFIMWFVGLYERAKKKNSDKESFDTLSTGLQSLTDLVKDLQASPHALGPAPAPAAFGKTFSASLITEAFRIFDAGHVLAALLQAGVAFEHALRSFAHRTGIKDAAQIPLIKILQKINHLLPRDWLGELDTLRQIRNQLAHASEQEIMRVEKPEVVLQTYAGAINLLNDTPYVHA